MIIFHLNIFTPFSVYLLLPLNIPSRFPFLISIHSLPLYRNTLLTVFTFASSPFSFLHLYQLCCSLPFPLLPFTPAYSCIPSIIFGLNLTSPSYSFLCLIAFTPIVLHFLFPSRLCICFDVPYRQSQSLLFAQSRQSLLSSFTAASHFQHLTPSLSFVFPYMNSAVTLLLSFTLPV